MTINIIHVSFLFHSKRGRSPPAGRQGGCILFFNRFSFFSFLPFLFVSFRIFPASQPSKQCWAPNAAASIVMDRVMEHGATDRAPARILFPLRAFRWALRWNGSNLIKQRTDCVNPPAGGWRRTQFEKLFKRRFELQNQKKKWGKRRKCFWKVTSNSKGKLSHRAAPNQWCVRGGRGIWGR